MTNQKICFNFARDGKCRFRYCKFSHDVAGRINSNRRTEQKPEPPSSERDFRAWRKGIPLQISDARPLGSQLGSFFKEARRLIEEDDGILQEVIRSLSGEMGLKRIKELVQRDFDKMSSSEKSTAFINQMLPFFETVTHRYVLDSLILEQAVGTIYNVLFGMSGSRAVVLLGFLADVLQSESERMTDVEISHLEISLLVFRQIVELNSVAFANNALESVAVKFETIFKDLSLSQTTSSLHDARIHLERILRRLDIGSTLPVADDIRQIAREKNSIPSFIAKCDTPGGRHDNDSADICDIKIMPTFKEIMSIRSEYLPVKDPGQWHIGGLAGLLDRNFRLLREDTVGQLRDAVHILLRPSKNQAVRTNQLKTYAYRNICVVALHFDRFAGLQFVVQFSQPANVQSMSTQQRQEWWQQSKRLQAGALVCLAETGGDDSGNAIFCTIAEAPRSRPSQPQPKNLASLWEKRDNATVTLDMVEPKDDDVQYILNRYRPRGALSSLSLVEFPGILLAAFEPTLRALQRMKRSADLPFSKLLAPMDAGEKIENAEVLQPPAYATRPGFRFDLSSLMKDGTRLEISPDQPVDIKKLQDHSTLDNAQAVALVNALQRSIGLIQGPPGTGKSYTGVALIEVLLANRAKAGAHIGPIICVCYTNHALDQLLEDLLTKNITTQIIRIGAQSKSELVDPYNLRKLVAKATKTKAEKQVQWQFHKKLDELEDGFKNLRLDSEGSYGNLKFFLRRSSPRHYSQLFAKDKEGFAEVEAKRGSKFKQWINAGGRSFKKVPRSIAVLQDVHLDETSAEERKILYNDWLTKNRVELHANAKDLLQEQRKSKEWLNNINNEVDFRCLREAHVVGVTTTGLARNLRMLQRLKPKVVLCEEAGEVLEAHLLTALLPSVEHAILIGDHMQLRPQVQDFNLSREDHKGGEKYSLDTSLFERLVDPDDSSGVRIPFSTLQTQRRMHPSIAQLVRDTLYPCLEDSPFVSEYPEVFGMRRRLFWLDHQRPEGNTSSKDAGGTSYWNEHEIEMTTALVNHLIRQGSYQSGDIAVLTPYLGQLHRLRRKLSGSVAIVLGERDQEELDKAGLNADDAGQHAPIAKASVLQTLRVATIDNFQGEEAKVVVISLVRSNEQKNCGFLRTSNRINVLLSRAKYGMYIIGNSSTSSHVPMWADVINILQRNGNFGNSLDLQCPRHPDTPISVSDPDHFVQFSPEGGCNQRCVNRLKCGHACKQKCHSAILHDAVYCQEKCLRQLKGCDHPCPKFCGDSCPKACQVKVYQADRRLGCGHLAQDLPCWQAQEPSLVLCSQPVQKQVTACNHALTLACHINVCSPKFRCSALCQSTLPCGHTCKRSCSNCTVRKADNTVNVDHGICLQKCGRQYSTCAHVCRTLCHGSDPCPPCQADCDVQCAHSKCSKKCCEPCAPCAESKCLSSCPHSECSLPCAAPCDNIPCSRRCEKLLSCGHQCPSVCGETCPLPVFCQICANQGIKDREVDFILSQSYHEINLDENPCIFPRCGHFLTVESMDGQMDMKKYYLMDDADEKPIAIASSSEPFSVDDIKRCATCRGSLRDISRYGRLVRRAILDESTKKFILYVNREYVPLAQDLQRHLGSLQAIERGTGMLLSSILLVLQEENNNTVRIDGSLHDQFKLMDGLVRKYCPKRWDALSKLRGRIVRYYRAVEVEEQPFNRVRDLVEAVRRTKQVTGKFEFDETILQTKGLLLAAALLIRLDIALLGDFLSLCNKQWNTIGSMTGCELSVNLQANMTACKALIDMAAKSNRVPQQVEGSIFLAQLCALQRPYLSDLKDSEQYLEQGRNALATARDLCRRYPGQTSGLSGEIDNAEKMLSGSTFYTAVTNEERAAVIAAMAREFRGTGHWYYCQNGHPFTIGECGGAVQLSTCPECGAPVGGEDHRTADGVTRAGDLEDQLTRLAI